MSILVGAIVCSICREPLRRIPRGPRAGTYVHRDGGLVMQRCGECEWQGSPYPPVRDCPVCGTHHQLKAHHEARPKAL
jgi:hypothetical protein